MFRPLQVLSACTSALAHGGNDVGNAIGPVVLLWIVFQVKSAREIHKLKSALDCILEPYWIYP